MLAVNPDVKQAFMSGLRDPDKRVRYISLDSLSSQIKDSDITDVAVLLGDEKEGIRELAHQILSRRGAVLERIGDRYRLVE